MTCEDAPCCGCCDPRNDFISPELAAELCEDNFDREDDDDSFDDSMDGDHESALASVYGDNSGYDDMACEGYDEN